MAITGLGGIFIKTSNVDVLRDWYQENLGVAFDQEMAAVFRPTPGDKGYAVLGLFDEETDYFAPSNARFMINFRVDNLQATLAELRAKDVPILGGPEEHPQGQFAWIQDPEGIKIELWQPN